MISFEQLQRRTEEDMSDRRFKVGEVVQLKSGGPQMTVVSVRTDGGSTNRIVECVWFTQEMKSETATFPEEALIGQSGPSRGAAEVANRLSAIARGL
jgi:uncharacterized protein YodC (DUF2158 family)